MHRALVPAARSVPGVTFRDLYELYPDYDVDPPSEQAALEAHDVIVFQHPFYWYSVPPLLKQWQDLVLEHGWAYGHTGTALQGKAVMHAISAGGTEGAYAPAGYNHYTVPDLLRPLEATARLCGMEWLAPFLVYGTLRLDAEGLTREGERYRAQLQALTAGTLNPLAVEA